MNPEQITVLILTHNEEVNIARTLNQLNWASRILIVDSNSNDKTTLIAKKYSNVEIIYREFDEHASQWNYGLEKIKTEWTLTLDADYVMSNRLIEEIFGIPDSTSHNGYSSSIVFKFQGKALKCSVIPARTVLFRTNYGNYVQLGHSQWLTLAGSIAKLQWPIFHDDRKPFSRWFNSQLNYSTLEADKICSTNFKLLRPQDKIRKLLLGPLAMPIYILIFKNALSDKLPGLYYLFIRTFSEALLAKKLLHRYLTFD